MKPYFVKDKKVTQKREVLKHRDEYGVYVDVVSYVNVVSYVDRLVTDTPYFIRTRHHDYAPAEPLNQASGTSNP